MYQLFAKRETETIQEDRKHFEVVLLLVTYDIDHFINGIVPETQLGSTDILRHIDRCAIRAQKQLFVQTIFSEISPNGTVFAAIELSFRETFFHFGLAFKISVGLVVNLIERDAQTFVCLIKSGIDPTVHFCPQVTHFFVALFPLEKHGLRLFHQWSLAFGGFFVRAVGHHFGYLLAVFFIKTNIVIADEMIAFLAAGFGRFAVAEFLPSKHGFADMYSAIVDDIGLDDFPAVSFLYLGDRPTE